MVGVSECGVTRRDGKPEKKKWRLQESTADVRVFIYTHSDSRQASPGKTACYAAAQSAGLGQFDASGK